MDTKRLVVGQNVNMVSGYWCNKGQVVNVTSEGAEVQITELVPQRDSNNKIRHDSVGNECYDSHERILRFNSAGVSCDGSGTFECGPWELADISEDERAAFDLRLPKHKRAE